jgi:hypothetical protein
VAYFFAASCGKYGCRVGFGSPPSSGLHSSTIQLKVNTCDGTYWVVSVTKTAQVELRSVRHARRLADAL